jgi:hypothetical protein
MEAGEWPVAGLSSWESPEFACLQCGGPIAEVLAWIGSLFCHDCRDEHGVSAIVIPAAPKHPPTHAMVLAARPKKPAAS